MNRPEEDEVEGGDEIILEEEDQQKDKESVANQTHLLTNQTGNNSPDPKTI